MITLTTCNKHNAIDYQSKAIDRSVIKDITSNEYIIQKVLYLYKTYNIIRSDYLNINKNK